MAGYWAIINLPERHDKNGGHMKIPRTLILPVLFAIAFAGCASAPMAAPSSRAATVKDTVIGADGTPRPDWVRTMSKKAPDTHYEIGYGKLSEYSKSLRQAETDARSKVSQWIRIEVRNILQTNSQDYGFGGKPASGEVMDDLSVQTSNNSISGAVKEDSWQDSDGGVYVLFSYPVAQVGANLEKEAKNYRQR